MLFSSRKINIELDQRIESLDQETKRKVPQVDVEIQTDSNIPIQDESDETDDDMEDFCNNQPNDKTTNISILENLDQPKKNLDQNETKIEQANYELKGINEQIETKPPKLYVSSSDVEEESQEHLEFKKQDTEEKFSDFKGMNPLEKNHNFDDFLEKSDEERKVPTFLRQGYEFKDEEGCDFHYESPEI